MSALQSRAANVTTAGGRAAFEKVVIVTRKTELEELVARFNTVAQAQFYLEHAGQPFEPIAARHQKYQDVLDEVRRAVPRGIKSQLLDRGFLPQFTFGEADLVITVGPDGLVVNVAKYLDGQPILALNPDPCEYDGVLMPFDLQRFGRAFDNTLRREQPIRAVTMAQATLNNGQTLLGFNDLFIGARSHVSARYTIRQGKRQESHSSSGIIVSTGAGSSGWLQSVYAGAAGVITALGGNVIPPANGGRMPWESEQLIYSVREPFPSQVTQTNMVYGIIDRDCPLTLHSHMAENGVIFSDGMQSDYLAFNAGSTATIGIAPKKAQLVTS
jgi:NAD kinase